MMLNKDPLRSISWHISIDGMEEEFLLIRCMNEILHYDAFLASLGTMTR